MTDGPLHLSPEERDRIVARARQMRAEAIADLFRSIGRGLMRLFGAPGRVDRRAGDAAPGRMKTSSA